MKLTHRVSSSTSSRCCGCRVSFTQLQLRWVSVQTSQGWHSSCYSKQEAAQQRGVCSQSKTVSASAGSIHRQSNCTKVPGRPLSNLQTVTVEVHEDVKTLIYALHVSLEVCRTDEAQICNINLKRPDFTVHPVSNQPGTCEDFAHLESNQWVLR